MRYEHGNITKTQEIQNHMGNTLKLENLKQMQKFLDSSKPSNLTKKRLKT